MKKIFSFFAIAAVSVFAAQMAVAQAPAYHGLDPKNLDTTVSPCRDFYEFANGGWLKANPIPPEYSRWGSFEELAERNNVQLRQILDEAAVNTSAPKGSIEQKVGDFYSGGMDSAGIEEEGAKPLAPYFERIAAIKNVEELEEEIARLHTEGTNVAFYFFGDQDAKNSTQVIAQVYQGGLGLPDRDYYLKEDERSKKIRDEYVAHVAKMFSLLGDDEATAAQEAKTVMTMETRLAQASMTRVQQRDPNAIYHKMSVKELQSLTPDFSWTRYFDGIHLADRGDVNVAQPDFVKEVDSMLTSVPVADWKVYLRWHLIHDAAAYLSSPFVNESFHFYGTVMNGTKELKPRWKRVLSATNDNIGMALGQLYVAKYFPPEAKARALEMVHNLVAALREHINDAAWMSDTTKKQALHKLDAFTVKIGYPDKWRDYSSLDIDRGPYVLNAIRASEFEFRRSVNKIGKPVDRTEWGMTPPTVNAYYNPTMNEIVFPAGILQPPFFDFQADDAVNYGGMGSVIGHEMTHGFDDEGRQFDADGNLKDWWTPADKEQFKERATKVEKQFDNYVAIDTSHINGKLTLGENIADLGGLNVAYTALENALKGKPRPLIDGFTPEQRFFLAWAQIWRNNVRPENVRLRLNVDPHSPGKFRAVGPISNMPEFYEAFHCKDGDAMMRAADVRAKIW
ncbi:MAG: M13 family metallopeptidase [Bacteroidota bacterium]|nr:M13 family metallopeptidase [Bacteroidota bacterium]